MSEAPLYLEARTASVGSLKRVVRPSAGFQALRDLSGSGAARAEDAQGTPTQSHISPSILVYKDQTRRRPKRTSLTRRLALLYLRRKSTPNRNLLMDTTVSRDQPQYKTYNQLTYSILKIFRFRASSGTHQLDETFCLVVLEEEEHPEQKLVDEVQPGHHVHLRTRPHIKLTCSGCGTNPSTLE